MRTIKGIEVPDWFIKRRSPESYPEPVKQYKEVIGSHTFDENYDPTLSDILGKIPEGISNDLIEVVVDITSYDADYTISVVWHKIVENEHYNEELEMYNKGLARYEEWLELCKKIDRQP